MLAKGLTREERDKQRRGTERTNSVLYMKFSLVPRYPDDSLVNTTRNPNRESGVPVFLQKFHFLAPCVGKERPHPHSLSICCLTYKKRIRFLLKAR